MSHFGPLSLPWISISSGIKCKLSLPSKVWSGSWRIIVHLLALFSCSFYSSHPSFLEPAEFASVSGPFNLFSLCLECSVPGCLHGSLPYSICIFYPTSLAQKGGVDCSIFTGRPSIGNAVGPHLCLLSTPDVLWSLDGQFPVHAESLFPLFVSLQEGFLRLQEFAGLVGGVGWKPWSYCRKEQPSTS